MRDITAKWLPEDPGPLDQAESDYLDNFKKINDSVRGPQQEIKKNKEDGADGEG